jgi:hypothetical protein
MGLFKIISNKSRFLIQVLTQFIQFKETVFTTTVSFAHCNF